MIELTVNEEVAAVLGGYTDAVEVRDSQGRLLRHFQPYLTPEEREAYDRFPETIDPEELRRLSESARGTGLPLAELWKRILSRKTGA